MPWPQTTLWQRRRESLCWATLDKTAQLKALPRSLETLTPVPPFIQGWGQGEQRKILPIVIVNQVQNAAVSSTSAGSTKQTPGGGEELHLSGHWFWNSRDTGLYFFGLLHWKESITELWITTHFCTSSLCTPHLCALNYSRQQGIQGKEKPTWRDQGMHWSSKEISKIHWMTKSCDSSRRHAHLHHLFVCRGQCLMFASQMDENLNLNYSLTDYKFPPLHERNI